MWWSFLPQLLGSAALLILPGLFVAFALRFRGFDAFGLAPALSVGVIVIASTATPFLAIGFGVLPVAAVAIVLSTVAWLATRSRTPAEASSPPAAVSLTASEGSGRAEGGEGESSVTAPGLAARLAPFAALGLASVLIGARVLQVISAPDAFSQTYDAVFHLNSVKFAVDTGQASSLTIGDMTGGGFYPAGWNAVAALVASTFGLDVVVAVNITSIIIAALFWPLGCIVLARWIVGRKLLPTLLAAIASASLGAFPLLMLDFGVLYPNLLSISILPGSIALAVMLLGLGREDKPSAAAPWLALLLSLSGLVVAHPTTFMAWLTWTIPMVAAIAVQRLPQLWRQRFTDRRALRIHAGALAGYLAVVAALWILLRPPSDASFWKPYHTAPQALGEALVVSPMDLPPAWLVAPLMLGGLWVAFKNARYRWVAGVFLIFTALFVIVSGFPVSRARSLLTGVWYNDSYRLAALLPLVAVVLVAVGADWASRKLEGVPFPRIAPDAGRGPGVARTAGVVLLAVAAVALGQQGGVEKEAQLAAAKYVVTPNSPLVSSDELSVIKRLREDVPDDAVILGNPYTGSALSYALGDRKSAQLHILSYVSPELQEIYDGLGSVTSDPDVCKAVRDEKSYYVLDFGTNEVHGGDHTPLGLRNLERNPGVQLVDSQGDAKVYRITACGTP